MTLIRFSADASQDLQSIGDWAVIKEIARLAHHELRRFGSPTAIEGYTPKRLRWRRAIPLQQLEDFQAIELDNTDFDEFRVQACDYVMLYRDITANEKISNEINTDDLLVVKVVHNSEMIHLIGSNPVTADAPVTRPGS